MQRFLVIRLSSIGDIVHTLPSVSALGQTFPEAEIAWVIEERYATLLEGNPFVQRVLKLDTLGWRRQLVSASTLHAVVESIRSLRAAPFDAVIDFQGLVKTGLIAWMCRSSRRIGFVKGPHREPGGGLFYTEQVEPPPEKHVIAENLALVEQLGAHAGTWQFPLPRSVEDEQHVEAGLSRRHAQEFILVNPGGGWISKRWSPVNYAALVSRLERELPWGILVSGSAVEEEEIREIIRCSGSRRAYYFAATLRQFVALARRAKLFIGGDTGPLHLAAAAGVPIVALYGPTDPARNGPFCPADIALWNREPVNHTRRARNPRFMEGISVDQVLAAVRQRLARAHEK